MRMDWTDLRVFLHVCEAGSMTAAATRCHLTLAAVSARVRGLEASLDVVLLQRRARGVAPTAAGEILARHARAVLAQVHALETGLLRRPGDNAGPCILLANSA
ncbi:MAG: LysR family transcriptional regulator, partial [Comamonadaceae bacterium]